MLTVIILRHVLAYAISATSPDITAPVAWEVAGEALHHATHDVTAAKLSAMVYEESRGRSVRGRAVCGVLQTAARGAECDRLVRDRGASYRAGIRKLREARTWCRGRTKLCPLAVYGGGNAWRAPRPQRYAARVLKRTAAIERAMRLAP